MFTFKNPSNRQPLQWYWFPSGFQSDEIDGIVETSREWSVSSATVSENSNTDEVLRKSKVAWIPQQERFQWIYSRLGNMIMEANSTLWGFDLSNMNEMIQYTEYHDDGGHYDFHLDVGNAYPLNQRKISITVQLSDPDTYEGGDFEIMRGVNVEKLPKSKGCVLVFPSYILHRVTPVTKGVRRSLVLWVGGDSYR